jgi:hypothetical protein
MAIIPLQIFYCLINSSGRISGKVLIIPDLAKKYINNRKRCEFTGIGSKLEYKCNNISSSSNLLHLIGDK